MNNASPSIPRPVVRTNQWVIVLSVIFYWVTGVYWIMAVPLIAGLMGIAFDFNPIMRTAKVFLKKESSAYIPEDKGQQKFNQLLAVFFLSTAIVSHLLHWTFLAYVASVMVCLAAFIAILGFCIGCFIQYQWSQYKNQSGKRN